MSMSTTRRTFLAGSLAAGVSLSASAEHVNSWRWKLLVANSPKQDVNVPIARDPWNGMLAHDGSLYLFGGAFPKYGPPKGPGDLKTLGVLNDLWQFDLQHGAALQAVEADNKSAPRENHWHQIEADDGRAVFEPSAKRPCGRVLPCWVVVHDKFYLFGGLTAFAPGWKTRLLNDLWCYDPASRQWTLLETDDGRMLRQPTQVDGDRPTALAAMGSCVIEDKIYLFAGWGGRQPSVVLSQQLWSFDVDTRKWKHLGNSDERKPWPPKRYCPALTAWNGKLYLWAGRDTQDSRPQFYNDLWEYDPEKASWKQLAANRRGGASESSALPSARYAMGHAQIDGNWYIFGGFGAERGNSPQLNDLWRLDLRDKKWTLLEPHDGSKDVSSSARRPCVRRVPAMTALDNSVYIFGGLDLTSGPDEKGPLIGFNDLWQGRVD